MKADRRVSLTCTEVLPGRYDVEASISGHTIKRLSRRDCDTVMMWRLLADARRIYGRDNIAFMIISKTKLSSVRFAAGDGGYARGSAPA